MNEDEIKDALKLFPGSRRGARGIIIDAGDDGFIYLTEVTPRDKDLTIEEEFFRNCSTRLQDRVA
jgi:hypothetical protein